MPVMCEIDGKVSAADLDARIAEKATATAPAVASSATSAAPTPQASMWEDEIVKFWFLVPLYAAGFILSIVISAIVAYRS